MKPGSSKLNPNATSYIPFSQRGAADKGEDFELSAKESNCRNEAVWFRDQSEDALTHCQPQNVSQSYIQCTDILQTAELSKLKDHCGGGELYASSSHNQNMMAEKFTLEEEFDMDLTYLQMTFPGISKDSLSEVYLISNCDVESAVDMLNQLEEDDNDIEVAVKRECHLVIIVIHEVLKLEKKAVVMKNQKREEEKLRDKLSPVDLSEKLPESLDIGDVPESVSHCELPSQKLKNMTGEAGPSTSGSSNLDIA